MLDKEHFYSSEAKICREHKPKPQVFSRWKAEFIERAPEILAAKSSLGDEQERIAELERMVGRLAMQWVGYPPPRWAAIRLFNVPLHCRRCGDNDRLSTICATRNIFT